MHAGHWSKDLSEQAVWQLHLQKFDILSKTEGSGGHQNVEMI